MSDNIDDFLDEVEWVTKEVQAVISGKVDIEASEKKEKLKQQQKENEKRKQEELILKGREGKGIKFDKYKSFCKNCHREYELLTPICLHCNKETVTSEQRKQELMEKVEEYKKQKSIKDENKLRWEN